MDSPKTLTPYDATADKPAPANSREQLVDASGEYLFNREDAFLVYASFCGDLARTAHALNIAATAVLKIADEDGWTAKLAPILQLKQSTRPGDLERAMNRAVSFVQAYRLKRFLDRVMNKLTAMDEEDLERYVFGEVTDKTGLVKHCLTTRPLADLAVALEKAHSMAYQALNDTAQERVKRKEQGVGADDSIGDLHAKLAEAMSAVSKSMTPRALLFDAQFQEAQRVLKVQPAPQPHPNDNDEH